MTMQVGWTESLAYLTVSFDSPLDSGLSGDCMKLFSLSSIAAFGTASSCEWHSATRMKVYLSSDSTVIPGTVLSTLASSLYLYGVPIGPFPGVLSAPVAISSVLVPRLSVRLSIPSVLNLCSAAVAIAAVESYGDPRPLLYTWSVTGSTTDVSTMQTRLASVTGPVLQLLKSDMLPGHSYGLVVRVKSSVFGGLGGANATVERLTVLNPTVYIDGAPELSPPLTGDLLLHGTVDYSTCTSLRPPTTYLFQWSVQPNTLALDEWSSQSSSLLVRAESLVPWVSYLFTLTLMRASGDVYSTATIRVTPRTVPPVAVLSGGDRTVRINSTILLDGSGSFDPVLGAQGLPLTYNLTVTSGPLAIPATVLARDGAAARPIGGGVEAPFFQVPAAALGEGAWTFCLTVARAIKDAATVITGPGDDTYTPSLPDCVTITVSDDGSPEVGIDIPSGVIDGTLRLLATERITAYGTIADQNMVPIRTMFTLADAAEPGVFNTAPMLTPAQVRAPVAPYITVINTSALDSDDHTYTLTFYAWFDGVSEAATASRTFTLPEPPRMHSASPGAASTIMPNPAPSFPQRFVMLCPEWYSSAPRFLPLRYSASADGFPVVDNNYSPVSTFYLPRLPVSGSNTITVTVSDWRNQSDVSTLQGSWAPDVGTLPDLLASLNAASVARDVGALPALAYQALMWISVNATDVASPELLGNVRNVMVAVQQVLPYVPVTRASVTQLVAIARLAGALVGPNMTVEALNVGADIVSALCQDLPEDLGTEVRYAIVDIIRSLLTSYAAIYDGPNKASISYQGGLVDMLGCVTEVLAPISGLDQAPILISTAVAQFQSHTMRRSAMSGQTFGSDGWPQFTLPADFADIPSLAEHDVLQVSYTASLVNSFSTEKFVAPIGSLTILDAGGKEVKVSGLAQGVRITFWHSAPAPRTQEGEMEPVYCIYWDEDAGVFSNLGCYASRSSDNDTECVCDHLTSFAISYSATFAPRGSRRFPIILVAAVIGGVLLLSVCALIVALLVVRARRADGRKANKHAHEEAQAHATDMAVLRSEITQKPSCDADMADAELRKAVHQEMARAGLSTPPLAPPPFAVPTREAPHSGKRDSLTSESLGSAVPVGGEEDERSAAAESDEQRSSVAAAAVARVALPTPLPSADAVPRKSEDRSHRGGGLRFWNKEMAYHSSDQVSSSVHSHSNV